MNHKPVYICGFYRSQRDLRSKKALDCLKESFLKLPGRKGKQHVVITGDANLHIDWKINKPQVNSFTKNLETAYKIIYEKNQKGISFDDVEINDQKKQDIS